MAKYIEVNINKETEKKLTNAGTPEGNESSCKRVCVINDQERRCE